VALAASASFYCLLSTRRNPGWDRYRKLVLTVPSSHEGLAGRVKASTAAAVNKELLIDNGEIASFDRRRESE
jgi:hypothetical protein